ncbi:alpha-1,4-glucan:maltose-1-phosphate maltosyltransferase [Palleronia marisminoris]|uniref:Alpha-1,4-glucan:maltose-1-phosphate maltosyltransferase n=1 Tax=Palleronia marisminoris TaxID=315423 RepID=A0A1Y5SRN0_9RHOB|nr:alpha-1,4-glucan--maltose-1-phosphate maltosyltransferase [Palleronia marisminoris]SFG94246.1 alpha-1,4-glucan:maltose-1-phosphate maltosyltransferase [Palleronia marisminoris]SLN46186.1 Alpha-1,4-glucan:maltose-1-phosphate maltosyltransferase 1 [Palleronia marisminoris]
MSSDTRKISSNLKELAQHRLVIEAVSPLIDGGRFAAKAVEGWPFRVAADIFGDGHEVFAAAVVMPDGTEHRMALIENDRWGAEIVFDTNGPSHFAIIAWRDLWGSWARDTRKKIDAGQDVSVEMQEAADLLGQTKAPRGSAPALKKLVTAAKKGDAEALLTPEAAELMGRIGPRANTTRYATDVPVWVDRERAAFSAWYELFPRSTGPEDQHGTFRDVIDRLDYVTDLGFDVLYFPPIHPIGTTNRKGKNNALRAEPEDVGSPYAIGSPEGGMVDVHPELGTLEDFDALVEAAAGKGLEIALDIALNASPDHPWIEEHPDWFERRPDGTIKFAENPPKKYEDIVNFRYYNEDGTPNAPFWQAIRDLFLFWAGHGVLSFRVDNPHTKPFPFWEWIIAEVRTKYPGAIFLSEAFTRPKVMKRLAKVGFNQSYTYYTWRNTKAELTEYLTELTTEDCAHYMRPNFFTNTPDINPYFNHTSGRPGFRTRAIMAASLSGNWGLYSGFELCEADWLPPKDEYLNSEKYELKHRDYDAPGHIKDDIRLINRIRQTEPAMRDFRNLKFFNAFDDRVLYYGRFDEITGSYLLFHVLIDPLNPAEFEFEVPMWEFGQPDDGAIDVTDMLQGNSFEWRGKAHRLALDPQKRPYAIWKLMPTGTE